MNDLFQQTLPYTIGELGIEGTLDDSPITPDEMKLVSNGTTVSVSIVYCTILTSI